MPAYKTNSDFDAIDIGRKGSTMDQQFKILKENLDIEFKFLIGLWIIFMQCGFALLEAGAVRSKNTTNILFKNFLDVFVGALAYWIFGFGFAYGVPGNAFIGHNFFFSAGIDHQPYISINISESFSITRPPDVLFAREYYSSWFFQFAFAATASTIVSGAMAERTQFVAYLLYSFIITGFVYPILSHWCWSPDGFLYNGSGTGIRFIDFAGSGVVHVSGGVAALVGTYLLGPRTGRYTSAESSPARAGGPPRPGESIRGHSVPLISMGGFILLTGFLAFNGGSRQTITEFGDGTTLSLAAINTLLAGSSGALTALVFNVLFHHVRGEEVYLSLITEVNGALAGMVSACAGSDDMNCWVAILLGAIAALLMVLANHFLNRHHIDDPLGAVSVHLVGGLVGVVLTPLFVMRGQIENGVYVRGVIFSNHPKAVASFGWNLLGAICIITWTGLNSVILFGILKLTGLLRISAQDEVAGLDIIKHGEPAYPESYFLNLKTVVSHPYNDLARNNEAGNDNSKSADSRV